MKGRVDVALLLKLGNATLAKEHSFGVLSWRTRSCCDRERVQHTAEASVKTGRAAWVWARRLALTLFSVCL